MEQDKKNIKAVIMDVSEALFAQNGFDGISIDEIAREAKINKSLIYYYFSNKEGLLISLIHKHIAEFEQLINKLQLDQHKRFEEMVKEIVTLAVDYICEHENIIKIMQHESLLDNRKRNAPVDIVTFIDPLWEKMVGSIKEKYQELVDVNFIDKSICIQLMINSNIILGRLDKNNPEEVEAGKKLYIERVSRIVRLIVSSTHSH